MERRNQPSPKGLPEERYEVHLPAYDGPLDLLLWLINQHEIDIFDIPISFITSKYLEYLERMTVLNLDLASDYLEMAAMLAYIKSRMLVPPDPQDELQVPEDGPDPREELVRRLLEYQKYKTAAEQLAALPLLGRDTFPRGGTDTIDVPRDLSAPGLHALIDAFQGILKRVDKETAREISVPRISVSARILELVDLCGRQGTLAFHEFFGDLRSLPELVVTFLALLEMTKLGMIGIHQAGLHGEIYVTARLVGKDALERLALDDSELAPDQPSLDEETP